MARMLGRWQVPWSRHLAAGVNFSPDTDLLAALVQHSYNEYAGTSSYLGTGFVEQYDDEQDAREHSTLYRDGSVVVCRTVISLPWVTVPQERTEEGQ